MKSRVKELEANISRLEAAISECETGLQNFVTVDETQRQTRELESHRNNLQSCMAEWEELSQELQK
jgi:chaperonin cofactor prefoldin